MVVEKCNADLAASVEGAVLAEGNHVVHTLAHGLGPHQSRRDAAMANELILNDVATVLG